MFFAVATAGISAELNPLFQDNAVLQCDQRVPVWGAARDGEKVTVAFGIFTYNNDAEAGHVDVDSTYRYDSPPPATGSEALNNSR